MSCTYNIQCDDCKKTLWIGQRDHIYSSEEHLDLLAKFLHHHENHHLMFVSEHHETFYEYEDETKGFGKQLREAREKLKTLPKKKL